MVIILNKDTLNDLFTPYELDFIEIEDVNKLLNISDEFEMELDIEMECSKSKNETCINTNCNFNLIAKHSDALYIKLVNGGCSTCKNN